MVFFIVLAFLCGNVLADELKVVNNKVEITVQKAPEVITIDLDSLKADLEHLKYGHLNLENQLAINEEAQAKVEAQIQDAVSKGAKTKDEIEEERLGESQ